MEKKNSFLEIKKILNIKKDIIFKTLSIVFVVFIIFHLLFSAPINNTNSNKTVTIHIASNDNVSYISKKLDNLNIIKSQFFLKSFIFLFKGDKKVPQGDYLFKKRSPVYSIAWQLSRGKHKINPIKVTLREGLTNVEMASILNKKLYSFDLDYFLKKTSNLEGYLFPDTYFFFPMDSEDEVINKIYNNFQNQTKKLKEVAISDHKNFDDIIKMASIIEGESSGEDDAFIISGILWKRIKIGMPLQVDVYKETYKIKGLPESPINNPGLISIKAALYPEDSSYLYYLHSKDGKVYFAKNFNEHNQNIFKYLK